MADPVNTPAAVAAPVSASAPAPTAVAEPVQTVSSTPAPVIAPAVETTPAVSVAAVEAPVEVAPLVVAPVETKTETLLGKTPEPIKPVAIAPETKPAEAVAEAKVTEGGQSVEPAPPPKYEAFQFPDGLKPNETKVTEFTNILSRLELEGKADHATVQKIGQELVNSYVTDIKKAAEGVTEYYQQTWVKQKADWMDSVVKDPEYGGNRLQTNLQAINSLLNTHGGTAEQVQEFRNVMETTGLGNNPAVWKLLVNISQAYKEGTPLAANKPVQQNQSRVKTLYSKSS